MGLIACAGGRGYGASETLREVSALLAIEGLRRRTDRQTTGGLGNISRAFAHRNYLVYVSGNSISLIGWWLERVAVGWLTWTLTPFRCLARIDFARRFSASLVSRTFCRRAGRPPRPGLDNPPHSVDRLRAGKRNIPGACLPSHRSL